MGVPVVLVDILITAVSPCAGRKGGTASSALLEEQMRDCGTVDFL